MNAKHKVNSMIIFLSAILVTACGTGSGSSGSTQCTLSNLPTTSIPTPTPEPIVNDQFTESDPCVIDNGTGLTWYPAPDVLYTYPHTSDFALGLSEASTCGVKEWRVPTYSELYNFISLGGESAFSPPLPSDTGSYWTSSEITISALPDLSGYLVLQLPVDPSLNSLPVSVSIPYQTNSTYFVSGPGISSGIDLGCAQLSNF